MVFIRCSYKVSCAAVYRVRVCGYIMRKHTYAVYTYVVIVFALNIHILDSDVHDNLVHVLNIYIDSILMYMMTLCMCHDIYAYTPCAHT